MEEEKEKTQNEIGYDRTTAVGRQGEERGVSRRMSGSPDEQRNGKGTRLISRRCGKETEKEKDARRRGNTGRRSRGVKEEQEMTDKRKGK